MLNWSTRILNMYRGVSTQFERIRPQSLRMKTVAFVSSLTVFSLYNYEHRLTVPFQDPPHSYARLGSSAAFYLGCANCSLPSAIVAAHITSWLVNSAFFVGAKAVVPRLEDRLYINAEVADLRTQPSDDSPLDTQAKYGDAVTYVGATWNGFVHVARPGNNQGFVKSESIGLRPRLPATADLPKVAIGKLVADYYSGPDTESRIGSLVLGTTCHLSSPQKEMSNERWVQAILVDGRKVWMQSDDLMLDRPHTHEEMIERLEEFKGVHYLWGGKTPYGVDCSGFCLIGLALEGIEMPHSAQRISEHDLFEEVDTCRRGDFVFFHRPGWTSPSERFSHMGLMISTDQFIHCTVPNRKYGSPHGGVQISSINEPAWKARFGGARRLKQTEH